MRRTNINFDSSNSIIKEFETIPETATRKSDLYAWPAVPKQIIYTRKLKQINRNI